MDDSFPAISHMRISAKSLKTNCSAGQEINHDWRISLLIAAPQTAGWVADPFASRGCLRVVARAILQSIRTGGVETSAGWREGELCEGCRRRSPAPARLRRIEVNVRAW